MKLVATWHDLASSIISMPHSSITRALEGYRLPPKALNTTASFYRGMRIRYRTAEGLTDSVPIEFP